MDKVRVRINPKWSSKVPAEIRRALPEELRVCPEHGEEVSIQELDNQSVRTDGSPLTDGPPFEAELVCCCDTAVRKVIEFAERKYSNQ